MSGKTIHLGISMAGAVSAGAYTAGVMDYILESLENWQKAKELQKEGKLTDIPKHNVVIDILSGASAGGMTAALTAALVQNKFEHIYKEDVENDSKKLNKNPLYQAWVNLTEDEGKDMMSQMLSSEDIHNNPGDNPEKEVWSIFNSYFIKKIAEKHIKETVKDPNLYRPYFANDLEVVMTLTNLRGIPFEVTFNNGAYKKKHRMTRHFDLAHFKLNPNEDYQHDGRIPIHFNDASGYNKDLLVQSAMATGGFPIGLEPRIINRLGRYVLDNPYLNLIKNKELATITSIDEYTSLNVDGGTINNDPFEITLKILNDRINASTGMEESKPEDFESVVLMIDPFPNDSEAPEINYKPMKAFRFIIPKILNAMLGELRMKENMYESAYDINNPSMFLIVPSRSEAKNENYIACGSLGGFGGFFSKEFRKHDFLLGRRNCQYFLRKYFSVARDAGNPILEYGYEDVNDMAKYAVDLGGKEFIPLIPDMRVIFDESTGSYSVKTQAEIAEDKYPFPNIKLKDILDLKKPLRSRFSVILDNISNGKAPETEKKESEILKKMRKKAWYEKALSTVFYKPLGWVGLKMAKNKARKMLADMFIEMVIQDMEDNELLNVNNKKPRLKI